jgi:hypothetical protein
MKFWGWVLVLAGCGRVGFEATSDGGGSGDATPRVCTNPVNHDEDADLVDDACDVCPHLPDASQADGDWDGVGDACDPNPTTPGDVIAEFQSFVNGLPPAWVMGAAADIVPDGLYNDGSTDGSSLFIRRAFSPGYDLIDIGLDLGAGALPLTTERQLTIGLDQNPASQYCEIEGDGTSIRLKYTNTTDSITYNVIQGLTVQSPFENGSLRFSLRLDPANNVACSTTWPPTGTVSGPGLAISPNRLVIDGHGFEITLRYLIDIRSP